MRYTEPKPRKKTQAEIDTFRRKLIDDWAFAEKWRLGEAVCLLVNIDPDKAYAPPVMGYGKYMLPESAEGFMARIARSFVRGHPIATMEAPEVFVRVFADAGRPFHDDWVKAIEPHARRRQSADAPVINVTPETVQSSAKTGNEKSAITHSGLPGRPSAAHLYLAEFERRRQSGEVEQTLAAEARALIQWHKNEHLDLPIGSAKTVENHIRELYNSHRNSLAE